MRSGVYMLTWALLVLAPGLVRAERIIKTSALMTCQENSQLQARSFNVIYHADNNSAAISASVMSTINSNFTAEIELIAYGITILKKSVNSCSVSSTLCPMTPGHFDVELTKNIDDLGAQGKDITKQVPGIAYTMPDLDGVVRVKVYKLDENTGQKIGDSIACVEAQLSNGKTVQTKYASWGLFAVIALGLVVAGISTLMGHISTASHITSNVVSLFAYFQSVAIICMMAVHRLPPIAASWGQNFMWTMGIISTKFMQKIMSWYVRSTGGKPTNILPNENVISIAVYRAKQKRDLIANSPIKSAVDHLGAFVLPRLVKRVTEVQNVTTTDERDESLVNKTLLLQGIKRVAFLAQIELSNFFLTGATFFIFIGLFLVLALGIVKLILELIVRANKMDKERFVSYRTQWQAYTKGVLFRYFLVGFTELSVLCLWEFSDRVSVATVVDAAVMYLIVVVCLVWASVKVIILARQSTRLYQNPAYMLYGNNEVLNRWGFLYVQFRATAYWFLIPVLAYNFVKAAVVALGQANGKVQAIIFLVVELAFLVAISWYKPYMDKKTNAFNISTAAISFINAIFFLFFSQLFGAKADVAASIVGVVFFVLNAVFSLVLLILIIIACIWALVYKNPDTRYQPMRDDREAFINDQGKMENNELQDMAEVGLQDYRGSFLHDDNSSSTRVGHETMPQAMRYKSHGSSEGLDNDYPSYRQYQSSAANGAFSSNPYSYNDGRPNLLDPHSTSARRY